MTVRSRTSGLSLVECVIALLVLSLGILSVLGNQLMGARMAHESWQTSVATEMARDLVMRIQLNPARAAEYRLGASGAFAAPVQPPSVDCGRTSCSTAELAYYELWQWLTALRGTARTAGNHHGDTPGIEFARFHFAPIACVDVRAGVVTVVVAWGSGLSGENTPGDQCNAGHPPLSVGGSSALRLSAVTLRAWVGVQAL